MALPVYYPEYHSLVETPGTPSRMPAVLIQTPNTQHWTIWNLPTWFYPQLKPKASRGYQAPAVRVNQGSLNTPKPNKSIRPLTGAAVLSSSQRGRFVAPSMAEMAGGVGTSGRAY